MKSILIIESWHNGTDNAVCEPYARCRHDDDAREILSALGVRFNREGLGGAFPPLSDGFHVASEYGDKTACFWLQRDREGIMSSEYRRIFQIVEEEVCPAISPEIREFLCETLEEKADGIREDIRNECQQADFRSTEVLNNSLEYVKSILNYLKK